MNGPAIIVSSLGVADGVDSELGMIEDPDIADDKSDIFDEQCHV